MIRDKESKALLETDTLALNKYRIEKKRIMEIENMKKEMSDIRIILSNVCQSLDTLMKEKFNG